MKKLHDLLHATHELKNDNLPKNINRHRPPAGDASVLAEQLRQQVSHGFIQSYPEMEGVMYPETGVSGNTMYQVAHRLN